MALPFLSRLRWLPRLALPVCAGLALAESHAGPLRWLEPRLYVDFSPCPPKSELLAHTVCLLDAECQTDFGLGRGMGNLYLARLPVLAVAPASAAWERAAQAGLVWSDGEPGFDRLLLDPLRPGWREVVIEMLAFNAARRGFDGFLIEGAAELAKLAARQPEKALARRTAFIDMMHALHERFPDKKLVLRGGWELLADLRGELHGLFLDGLFRRLDAQGKPQAVSAAEAERLERNVRLAQTIGLKVWVAEPGDPANARVNAEAAERLRRLGCAVVVTDGKLNGRVLGPHLPESRTVLVLHGWEPSQEGVAARSADKSWTARELEPALKWLGLAPLYLPVTDWRAALEDSASALPATLAGVIIDADCAVPGGWQESLAHWLEQLAAAGTPLLLGGQPFTNPVAWGRLAHALKLEGDGQELLTPGALSLSGYDASWFIKGRFPDQRALRCLDLRAPAGAERVLSYRQVGESGEARRHDVVFIAPWGGVWLARSASAPVEVFRWLEAALRREQAGPVPDTSTLAGRRVFLSTVQGAGFCEMSWMPGGRLCAEVLRDELEKAPELPVTVAVAEADIRGWSEASEPTEAGRYEALARSIFALPQVEPAANTMSRPLSWVPTAFQPGPLRPAITETRFNAEREVAGSLDFVRRRLLPPGKSTAFLLWPEGSAPGAEAAACIAGLDGWHLPDSWQAGWNLGHSGVRDGSAPAAPAPDDARALAQAWMDAQGGADSARRMGPAHLAYSFSDLKKPVNVEALRHIRTWCAAQPWHLMTASAYARFLADAAACRIDQMGPGRWRVISEGRSLTLRLPVARGLPDLARSRGVIGYREHAGQLYLHLHGREISEVVLLPAGAPPAPHLHLVEADRELEFIALEREKSRFRVRGRESAVVTLGGLAPGAWYQVQAAGSQARLQADQNGELTFQAPPLTTIEIQPSQFSGKSYAAR